MGCQIGDATDGVALYLDIGRHHLPNQRRQPSEGNDQDFIFGYMVSISIFGSPKTPPPYQAESLEHTVDCKIAQCRTGSSLHFNVRTLQ